MHSRNTLCVHVGQCGTQLGAELWKKALPTHAECAKNGALSPLVSCQMLEGRAKLQMHAVVVDAEPKVATRFEEVYRKYQPSVVHGDSGMGSCWAAGYNCNTAEASRLLDSAVEAIRRKLEAAPCTSLLFTCSLSGGTGSGMTSALLQYCADEYAPIHRIVAGVLPFETGDNPLKHYNTMLSAQYMYEFGDAVLLRSNDLLAREASDLASRHISGPRTHSIPHMNQVFAQDIAALMSSAAVDNATTLSQLEQASSGTMQKWIDNVVSDVCVGRGVAGASFDVLTSGKTLTKKSDAPRRPKSQPSTSTSGSDQIATTSSTLGRSLWNLNQHLRGYQTEDSRSWHSMRMHIRSSGLPNDARSASIAYKALKKVQPMITLPSERHIEWLQYESPSWKTPSAELTVVTHAPWIASDLQRHVDRATDMLKVRAFVHWYERAQCTELDIHSAVASVREQVQLSISRHRSVG